MVECIRSNLSTPLHGMAHFVKDVPAHASATRMREVNTQHDNVYTNITTLTAQSYYSILLQILWHCTHKQVYKRHATQVPPLRDEGAQSPRCEMAPTLLVQRFLHIRVFGRSVTPLHPASAHAAEVMKQRFEAGNHEESSNVQ